MIEHVTEWLGPYLDGELHGARLIQVEGHLAECTECRMELAGMKGLSALLRETPPAAAFRPAERFIANLNLKLPRQIEKPRSRRLLETGWWLMPLGLLAVWFFLQVTFSLSSFATLASSAGLLGGNLSWLQGRPLQMAWFTDAMSLFGGQMGLSTRSTLSVLNDAEVFATQWTSGLFWQLLLGLGYLGWLISWWLRHPGRSAQTPGGLSSS